MEATNIPKINLAAARVNAGYTQKQASNSLGITPETLRAYETGKTIPQWDFVEKIEKLYEYPSSFIFFGDKLALSDKNVGSTA